MAQQKRAARVAVVMGSSSDLPTLRGAVDALEQLDVPCEVRVVSAHRTPEGMAQFAREAAARGIRAIVAGAGGAAHLPGMLAAHTTLPVIGVPVPVGHLQGIDALLSIAQMPRGVPVATVAIGGAFNAGLLAARFLAYGGTDGDAGLARRLEHYRETLREHATAMDVEVRASGGTADATDPA